MTLDASARRARNGILNEIFRHGATARHDLSRRLNISPATVGRYAQRLIDEGVLVETEPAAVGLGRRPVPLRLNPDYGCFLGVDFEPGWARAVLTDFEGTILAKRQTSIRTAPTEFPKLTRVISLARDLTRRYQDTSLISVGVAAPGLVDGGLGRIRYYELTPSIAVSDVPVRDSFEREFGVPTWVENDIRAMTVFEKERGAGVGYRNFLCLAVRSGVGMGIVIHGEIYAGAGSIAGEVGMAAVAGPKRPRKITELISARSITRRMARRLHLAKEESNELSVKNGQFADVAAAAESGHPLAIDELKQVGGHLGMLLGNLATVFAPEKIILVGEVVERSPTVRREAERTFHQQILPQTHGVTSLDWQTSAAFDAASGAAYLAFLKSFPEDGQMTGTWTTPPPKRSK